jgi:uncharacterized protein
LEDTTQEIIEKTIAFAKATLANAEGGHDWFHIERVYKNALLLAQREQVNTFIVALGALLHDLADSKFHKGDETVGPKLASQFLIKQNVDSLVIEHVLQIIKNISFRGGNKKQSFHSPELDVVQDADRLDAIGAIGIARAFNYGGFKNRKLYDPAITPQLNMTPQQYKTSTAPTINHFYEKLLLLKELMNTETGRTIAEKRHQYMKAFLKQFYAEWQGQA